MFEDIVNFRFSFEPETARCIAVWTCIVSALMIGPFLAFAVTTDAGVRCPLAFLRLLHRISLVFLSLALAYLALFVVKTGATPSTPTIFILVGIFVTTAISGIRHSLAGPIPLDNRWNSVWGKFSRLLLEEQQPRKAPTAR